MKHNAKLEFTCHDWGFVVPPHDSQHVVRPETRADAEKIAQWFEAIAGHMRQVAQRLPVSNEGLTAPEPITNQVVTLTGVSAKPLVRL